MADDSCPTCNEGEDARPKPDDEPGWWHMRPGESMEDYEARLAADPRWK